MLQVFEADWRLKICGGLTVFSFSLLCQAKLEKLLQIYPQEEVESKRWEKIANALGNRTLKQVCFQVCFLLILIDWLIAVSSASIKVRYGSPLESAVLLLFYCSFFNQIFWITSQNMQLCRFFECESFNTHRYKEIRILFTRILTIHIHLQIYAFLSFFQVASRVQKYFIKLAKSGLPVPGRMPNLPRTGVRVCMVGGVGTKGILCH